MEYKVHYNGQETSDFDTLASWIQELKKENKRLKEANEQYRDDYIRLKLGYDEFKQRNRDLEEENKNLKTERSKTKEVLKRYCGDSVDAPISTMVGLIIDDYFNQKAETEYQVKALQKAEKTIADLNKELVEYADKVKELDKICWLPDWCQVIDKLDELIDEEAPERRPSCLYLNRVEEIIDKISCIKNAIRGRNQVLDQRKATIDRLRKENEKLIFDQGNNAIGHAVEITDLKQEISALKKELEERKNKRSPRWPSDVMKIGTLENKVDKLTKENEYLKYKNQLILSEPCHDGLSIVAENRRLREEVESLKGQNEALKIKNAYPICPIFEVNRKEAANRIAERIRKGLD